MVLVCAAMVVAVVPGFLAPAKAYPVVSCAVSVHPTTVKPAQLFTVAGKSSVSEAWSVKFHGTTRHFTGKTFSTVLTAPSKPGTYQVTVRCVGSSGSRLSTVALHVTGNGVSGHLPNTGGPSLWWAVGAGGALLVGGALMAYQRFNRKSTRGARGTT